MTFEQGKYNIKAVSQLLGIQPGTLRAWERRYKIIAPVRNEAGYRLYTETHVNLLRWLIKKVNDGFTISQAITLLDENKKELAIINNSFSEEVDFPLNALKRNLINSLLNFAEDEAQKLLDYAFSIYSSEKVVFNVLGTIFNDLSNFSEERHISSAHEQYVFAFIRSKVGGIIQRLPEACFPKVISVCVPEESHELGLLLFSFFLRKKGFNVIYLGTSIVENDLLTIISEIEPTCLFLSCTMNTNVEAALSLIDNLTERFSALQIGIGGVASNYFTKINDKNYQKYLIGSTMMEWEDWLEKNLRIG